MCLEDIPEKQDPEPVSTQSPKRTQDHRVIHNP